MTEKPRRPENPSPATPDKEQDAVEATRCGYVALIGAPNAGKSTLLNQLVGRKLAIVTPKVQTTRTRLLGIALAGSAQLILVDTPGIFEPRRRLDRAMVAAAWAGAADADRVVLLVDAARPDDRDTRRIVDKLKESGRRAVLALNKVDLVRRDRLLGIADALFQTGCFDEVFMVSALTGSGVADLKRHLAAAMPLGPWLFPEDQLSDAPERWLAAEVTREQVFLQLHDELPYAASVETESWEERRDGSAQSAKSSMSAVPGSAPSFSATTASASNRSGPAPAPNSNACSSGACTCSCSSRCATTGSRTRNASPRSASTTMSSIRRDCFAPLAMTARGCYCEERSDEEFSTNAS